uniref:YdeI/OmpD-associated family protein n=1 Tax=Elaeophora elaphi TaxID=1147741 RepID=A0A0R3RMN5_9BILA
MVPPFLVGESESTLAEWKELLDKNDDKPDYEVQALVEEWMKKRGDEIKVRNRKILLK